MADKRQSLINRYEHTADTYEQKGRREWAYAKNDQGGEHYQYARSAFERAKDFRDRADALKKSR